VLSQLCHPTREAHRPLVQWLQRLLLDKPGDTVVMVPEIADYETRRGLLHIALKSGTETTKSLRRLDFFAEELDYLPLTTKTMRRAARLWAEARHAGAPTADARALDGDVILAAQALEVDGIVVTEDTAHLQRFVEAKRWNKLGKPEPK
jgi:predicted nucleic acid-binding protein